MSERNRYDVPETRDQIIASLDQVRVQAGALWQRFDERGFFEPPAGGGWSPAGNIQHLIKSTSPVTMALGFPRLVLRVMFGAVRIPSRSFIEVRAAYRAVLADGAQAGRFAPRDRAAPNEPAQSRQQLLDKWQSLIPRLSEASGRWDEAALDRYRLPHPLLGKLTLREMLFFTLYHLGHHVEVVAARQAGSAGAAIDSGAAQ